MKILLHAPEYNIHGGIGKHIFHIGKELKKAGVDFEYFVGIDRSNSQKGYLKKFPDKIKGIDFFISPFLFYKYSNYERFDIIHSHALIAYDSTLIKKKPVIVTLHGTDHGVYREYLKEIQSNHIKTDIKAKIYFNSILLKEKIAYKRVDKIISVSNGVREEVQHYFHKNSEIIQNGVDIDEFYPGMDDGDFRVKHRLNRDDILILFIGQSDWRKGLPYLIETMQYLEDKYKLIIIGLFTKNFAIKNIINLGFVSEKELKEIYSAIDIFILPSLYEGMPLVLLEAMACGKACIITRINGSEIIENNENGLIIKKRDIPSMISAIEQFSNENTRYSVGKKARETVIDLTWTKMVSKLLKIYDELI